MKDLILISLLNDFVKENSIETLPESKAFEHFINYCMISRIHSGPFSFENISVGGGNDLGIDGLAIIVNEHLVLSIEEVDYFKSILNRLDVEFVFIQSKTAAEFDSGEMNKFIYGVKQFFAADTKMVKNEQIQSAINIKNYIYELSIKMENNPECHLYYVTTGKWASNPDQLSILHTCREELLSYNIFSNVSITPIDSEGIQRIYRELKHRIIRQVEFDRCTTLPSIDGVTEAYIGIMPGTEYIKLICDDEGNLQRNLFYDNVRDFQGNNPVNLEISQSLEDKAVKDRFALLNNGITIVSKSINRVGNKFNIRDYQIVNGCQTSHIMYRNKDYIDNSVYVPIKLIVTADPEITNQVIKATNRQTEVLIEAFESLNEFHKKLEMFYNSFHKSSRFPIFYERRSKQYDNQQIERYQIVSMATQIKTFLGMFLNEPHSTHRYYGELLKSYRTKLFAEKHSLFPYYVSGLALCSLEKLFRDQKLQHPYKRLKYQLLMIYRILLVGEKIPPFDNKKIEEYCTKIIDNLADEKDALKVFSRAAEIIDAASDQLDLTHALGERSRQFSIKLTEMANEALVPAIEETQLSLPRKSGVVKFYDYENGWGFIVPDEKGDDLFVHWRDIISDHANKDLKKGQRVQFSVASSTPKDKAILVTPVIAE
jgi:cold shock CspA family protein